ncbi:MAG: hypothetical protein MOGMAGMI_00192 [Candidatus Omnitrophica bacterium]|nr:hypothetical protein [Candidatus Omnitrophota bacterium]
MGLAVVLIGCVAGTAVLIWSCLRWRDSIERGAMALDPRSLWKAEYGAYASVADLLIGVAVTGWTSARLVIKSADGQAHATVTYGIGSISIEVGAESYRVRYGHGQPAELLPDSGGPARARCLGYVYTFQTSRYELSQGVTVEVRGGWKATLSSTHEVHVSGRRAGVLTVIGQLVRRGTVLVIPAALPMADRAFVMAMEYRRFIGRSARPS